jgi:hypothetical protein
VADNTVGGSTILTDGFSAYPGLRNRNHMPKVVGTMAAHSLLPWIHRVFSNLKRLALGVYHGFRKKHIQAYLDEFVFRWNRRRHYRSAFDVTVQLDDELFARAKELANWDKLSVEELLANALRRHVEYIAHVQEIPRLPPFSLDSYDLQRDSGETDEDYVARRALFQ